ncbi:hypothetical protein DPEC_G00301940 [Dallia pectoralis]|uniref:Uncharacterized protein n=1 Tax=Dallia pectoralis TaxID=75939 RepID=A0ACC2FH14_DALPE|nr:hypothetical protein DPEC_G00301940 [Dallia pectoralis]
MQGVRENIKPRSPSLASVCCSTYLDNSREASGDSSRQSSLPAVTFLLFTRQHTAVQCGCFKGFRGGPAFQTGVSNSVPGSSSVRFPAAAENPPGHGVGFVFVAAYVNGPGGIPDRAVLPTAVRI